MGGPQLTRGSVVQAAERVQELVRIATTRSGQARATLQLKPEALGQVDVQLRTTRDGLVATIAAHDQAGLDALQQAGTELRRTARGPRRAAAQPRPPARRRPGRRLRQPGRRRARPSSGRSGTASSYGLGTDDDEVVAEDELTLTTSATADRDERARRRHGLTFATPGGRILMSSTTSAVGST